MKIKNKLIKLPDKIPPNVGRFLSKLKIKNIKVLINKKEENKKMQNIIKQIDNQIKNKKKFQIAIFILFVFLFSFSLNINTVFAAGPTVTLTSATANPTNGNIAVTATFSESVADFVVGDITVTNGTVGNFAGSDTTYTFDVTPTVDGIVTVDILAGVATGAGGTNAGTNDLIFGLAKQFGNTSTDVGNSIFTDSSGNIYTTGSFSGVVDFDPGAGTVSLDSANGSAFISKLDSSGDYVWAKQIGGYGNSIVVDSSGNVYTTGYFSNTADFDPGAGVANLTSVGLADIFISKLDSSGNYVWAKGMGGSSGDGGFSIAVDSVGNVYATGYFNGTSDFDPGAGTANLVSAGSYEIFISKLDSSGNYVWAKKIGSTGDDRGNSIVVDSNSNVYITGHFNGTVDFDPGAGTVNLVSAGFSEIFVSKLDLSGNYVWAKKMGGTNADYGKSIAVDSSGNVYITGYFNSTADFDPGAGTANLISAGGTDVFVSKLDSSGDYVWANKLGGTGGDTATSLVVDSSGNIYTAGYFGGTADFDPGASTYNLTTGNQDIFISKLDSSGNYVLAKQIGGTSFNYGYSISVDSNNSVYTTGSFIATADFDPGAGTVNLVSSGGSQDMFISKLALGTLSRTYVDNIAPTPSAPISTVQALRNTVTSSSTVQSTEAGNIYLVKNGTASTTQGNLDSAVAANTAFIGKTSAVANTPYTITPTASLVDGVYDIVAVDVAGNISSPLAGWLTVDNTAPTNQDSVLTTNQGGSGGTSITIVSSGDATNNVWLAPSGTTSFTAGATMTSVIGTSTIISAPATEGIYYLYVIDAAGNYSVASTHTVTVDTTDPIPSAPISVAQTLNSGTTSTSTVQTNEAGNIYLVKNGAVPTGAQSASANLTNLVLSGSPSNYTFSAGTYNYNGVTVSNATSSVTVTPTGAGVITVNGVTVSSGVASGSIALTAGVESTIDIIATETDKSPKLYTIKVIRGSALSIGQSYQGGKIAYLDGNGGGLIAATADQSTSASWGCYGTGTQISGADGTAVGTGYQNTLDIMAGCATSGIAARVARAYTGGSYSDWYLPSKDELNQLYINRVAIGGFTTGFYYSSSEYTPSPNNFAWQQYFSNGTQGSGQKNATNYYTRAIRSITPVVTPTQATPTFSISGGAVAVGTTVTITSAGADAIYYTTNGTTPTTSSTNQATTPLVINSSVTVKALAVKAGYNNAAGSASYTTIFNWDNAVQSDLDTIVSNNEAFIGKTSAAANTSYTVDIPAGPANGVYDIVAVDEFSNVSNPLAGWLTIDNTAPINQDTVFTTSISKRGGDSVTVVSSGDATNNIWFAPSGTTVFTEGVTMTTAVGTATTILAPATEGIYYLYIIDSAGNISSASTATLKVDNTLPTSTITAICTTAGNGCTTPGQALSPQEIYSVQSITGTAADNLGGSEVGSVQISIQDKGISGTDNGNYLSVGTSFTDVTETYITTTGTDTWSFDSSAVPLVIDHIYLIHTKAIDVALNEESPVQALSFKFVNSPPVVSNVTASMSSSGVVTVGYDVTDVESTQTTNYLYYLVDATLDGTITSGATSLTVSDATHFPSSGTILIDDEMISYASKSGNILQTLTRGALSTTAYAHTTGALIYLNATSATGTGIGLSNVGTGKAISWIARTDADGYENATETIKVVVNDGSAGSMIGSTASSAFIFDAKKPTAIVTFDAGSAGVTDSATITIPMPTDISTVEYLITDGASEGDATTSGWTSITTSTTIPWTFDSGIEIKNLKYQYRDAYGNTSTETITSTLSPILAASFLVQDASNITIPSYDMYIGWEALGDITGFSSYNLEYATSTDNVTYGSYASVGDGMSNPVTNYYVHRSLDSTKFYRYRLGVVGTDGNTSIRAGAYTTAKPDGVQNYGEGGGGSVATASKVENVVPTQGVDKDITVTYRLTDESLAQKIDVSYEARVFYNIGITLPSNAYSGGNLTVSDASKLQSSGYIQINNEIINYTGKTGNILTGLTRGTWPTAPRATRQNLTFFAGTPVWVMATTTTPTTITNSTISSGQNGSISWTTYDEPTLAGSSYTNVGVRVLVHDNQDSASGPVSSQNDYSENGILNTLDLTAPTIAFDAATSSDLESVTPATFGITLARAYPLDSTVDYAVTGTATGSGTDYTLASGTATILAGQTTTNITATIVDDSILESSETIILTISNPSNATLGANTTHTYTITDNESTPTIAFTSTSSSGAESITPVNIEVTLLTASGIDTTVDYAITGTATGSGTDYTLAAGTATISAGQTTINISLAVVDDSVFENDETIILTISNPTNATLGINTVFTYTITDNDNSVSPTVGFSSVSSTGSEGVIEVNIPVTTSVAFHQAITVDYAITGGTATGSGTDYTLASGTATITAGQTSANISLTIVDDSIIESSETIIITISNPINATLGANTTHTYTITENDLDETGPVITLTGDDPMSVIRDAVFTDPGATSLDDVDGDITLSIVVSGSVDTATLGSYTLTYTSTDSAGNETTTTRTVNVVLAATYNITATAGSGGTISPLGVTAVPSTTNQAYTVTPDEGYSVASLTVDGVGFAIASSYTFTNVINVHTIAVTFTSTPDTTAPVITLLGDNPMSVTRDQAFSDPGATATDDIDGDLTLSITTLGTVNTSAIGSYTRSYRVSDTAGNTSIESRTVNVVLSDSYNITSSTGAGGTISPLGVTAVLASTDQAYTITPNEGYEVSTLIVDGLNLAPENSYTFSSVTASHTIAVTFVDSTIDPPIITVLGDNPMSLDTGTEFVDPGITATESDAVTEITGDSIVTTMTTSAGATLASIDTTTGSSGNIITYTVTGSDGGIATATRTVNVNDVTSPVVSSIATPIITSDSVAITWVTNEQADGQILYGTESGTYGSESTLNQNLLVNHLITLTGLTPETVYYYVIKTTDAESNMTTTDEQTFTTTAITVTTVHTGGGGGGTVGVLQSIYDALQKEYQALKDKYIEQDLNIPVVSNVTISNITPFSATVKFETDKETRTFVEYGIEDKYNFTVANRNLIKTHSIQLSGLTLGTNYSVKVYALDKYSNLSEPVEQTFKTKFLTENMEELKKVENIEQFQKEIEETIESILPSLIPPFIDTPKISDITENSAIITFRTNIKAYPIIAFTEDSKYIDSAKNSYDGEISDTSAKNLLHTLQLIGLKPNTKYHFVAKAFSIPEVIGKSEDLIFTTAASKIQGSIVDVKKDMFTVMWTTDEPTSSIIEYKNMQTGRISRTIDNVQNNSHSVRIENLSPGTSYQVNISGINEKGNTVESGSSLNVKTSTDSTAPEISNLKVNSTLVSGRTDKVQTIISWQTDEPSTSSVYYEEGSGSLEKALSNKQEEVEFTKNHVVILASLKPGTVYRFTVESMDDANNISKPPIRTIITPKKIESIVDVIFKNFNETFNFINNVR